MKKSQILKKLDLKYIWHPCSQMKDYENLPLIAIKRAKGALLFDFDDKAYIDCVSSWWVNNLGHLNKKISKAIKKQLKSLEHIILAGFTHEPIIKLSKRLCKLTKFDKCFYADNGSSAVEVALKMSFHYHLNLGKKKSKFISLSNSYHGETIGALSLGDVKIYKETYEPLLFECLKTPVPKSVDFSEELNALKQILENHKNQISAFIIEPLIQCAGNMHIYSGEFIKEAMKLCKEHKVHIIFDEIATGFGRSGELFAMNELGVKPDFLCLSKGITGGFLPLSVVLTSDEIYNAFYGDFNKAFLHSHSYTGNALASAAANAVLDIFERENIIEKNKKLGKFIKKEFDKLKKFEFLGNFRQKGMIYAFDILHSKHERAGLVVFKKALKKGVILRPLGNTIYFMPPFVISKKQIKKVTRVLNEVFTHSTKEAFA